jgi:hypothetical protein
MCEAAVRPVMLRTPHPSSAELDMAIDLGMDGDAWVTDRTERPTGRCGRIQRRFRAYAI